MAGSGRRTPRWIKEQSPMMVSEQWLAFVRNLDWVTAHFGHR